MTLFWKLVLASLLCTPPAERLAGYLPLPEFARAGLRQAAVDFDLVEHARSSGWFDTPGHVENDLKILRRRAVVLADCPFLAEAHTLPAAAVCYDWIEFNREYESHLVRLHDYYDGAGRVYEAREYARAIEETKSIRAVWCEAALAVNPSYDLVSRRQALYEIRRRMGSQYSDRCLPPPVPLHRFATID